MKRKIDMLEFYVLFDRDKNCVISAGTLDKVNIDLINTVVSVSHNKSVGIKTCGELFEIARYINERFLIKRYTDEIQK